MILRTYRRDALIVGVLALVVGLLMASALRHPGYTDAYYYFNAALRLVQGKGLTDAALWTYLGIPSTLTGLPVPSHLYWMPLASLVASLGMVIGGATFDGAQIVFVALYVGLALIGFTVGALLGQSQRVAWISALLTIFSGYFMPFWTTTDTFALYGVVGALCLLAMGLGRRSGDWRWFALSGVLAGLAHLARADGVLLVIVLVVVALWPDYPHPLPPAPLHREGELANDLERNNAIASTGQKSHDVSGSISDTLASRSLSLPAERGIGGEVNLKAALIGVLAYLVVMAPWFIRTASITGSILPIGGTQTAWMRSYDEIVNYPPGATFADFAAWGLPNILQSRWQALLVNVQTFVAIEGMIVLTPFMLIALWRRRRDPLLSGFWLYTLGLHVVMTFVFAFPGYRGGLFHSASALLPFWAVLGVLGLDDALAWLAKKRHWRLTEARIVFGGALLIWAVLWSVLRLGGQISAWNSAGQPFEVIAAHVSPSAVVMINDPAALYYFTGITGVVVPNAPPSVIPDLAARFGVTDVVLDQNRTVPMDDLFQGKNIPPFLAQEFADGTIRIFKVNHASP